jgi:hypothetical protein
MPMLVARIIKIKKRKSQKRKGKERERLLLRACSALREISGFQINLFVTAGSAMPFDPHQERGKCLKCLKSP